MEKDSSIGHCQIRGKGQITIPPQVRSYLSLNEGDIVTFYLHEDNIVMAKAQLTIMKPKKS
jgi:AbrB family looped-hinge helix DNA binding protein